MLIDKKNHVSKYSVFDRTQRANFITVDSLVERERKRKTHKLFEKMSGNLSQILNSEQQQVLQIVSIENGQFVLDEKNLSRILLSADVRNDKVKVLQIESVNLQFNETFDQKVYIVSIVGAFRTGKSFLLTSFLKHVNSRLLEESATGETCFKWSYGSTPQTRGIWMSQRPVRYVNEANEQVNSQTRFGHIHSITLLLQFQRYLFCSWTHKERLTTRRLRKNVLQYSR